MALLQQRVVPETWTASVWRWRSQLPRRNNRAIAGRISQYPPRSHRPRVSRGGPAGRSAGWQLPFVSALATLLSWRTDPWRPVFAGLSSWQEGLALGFEHHLQWGPQVIFTFGPYGFVEDILSMFWVTAAVGLLYALVVTWGLAALIVSALRKPWGLLPAGVVAWASVTIAANLLEASELALATALGLALASLSATSERGRLGLLGALGALAGFRDPRGNKCWHCDRGPRSIDGRRSHRIEPWRVA